MGCGSSKNFDDAGAGQTLGGSNVKPINSKKTTTNSKSYGSTGNTRSTPSVSDLERREAMAKAAEERNKKGANRGTPQGGKLSVALKAQASDGGRREEAIQAGSSKNQAPLVWD